MAYNRVNKAEISRLILALLESKASLSAEDLKELESAVRILNDSPGNPNNNKSAHGSATEGVQRTSKPVLFSCNIWFGLILIFALTDFNILN